MEEILEFFGASAGWIVGIGVTLGVASALTDGSKPLAKRAIKGYFAVTDRVKVAAAELGENLQDLYAEAKMEYDTGRANGAAPSSIIVPGRETA